MKRHIGIAMIALQIVQLPVFTQFRYSNIEKGEEGGLSARERMELLRHLREEMNQLSANQKFEEAAAHRDLLWDIQQTVKSRANVKRSPRMLQKMLLRD